MQPWDARSYDRFEAERARPSRELIARIPLREPRRILDLGCGSGLSTLELSRAFPGAEIVGVDISADMLTAAAKRLPGAAFVQGDVGGSIRPASISYSPMRCFIGCPRHLDVIHQLARALPQGGALAFQMPDNEEEPSHRLMRAVAARPGFEAAARAAETARERIGGFADYDADARPALRRGRPLAHPLFASSRLRRRHRQMGRGRGVAAISRCAGRIGASEIPRRLSRGGGERLPGFGQRRGAVPVSAAVLRWRREG